MRTFRVCLVGLLLATVAAAEETRVEIVKPATPALDAKPNSDSVPDVYAIPEKIRRVVVARFKYKADLLAGLETIVKTEKIRNGVILSAVGSVRGYHFHTVSNRTFPSKDTFVKNPDAPADIVSMNGYIIGGRVHAHVMFANPDKAFGGHLESGTEVFTFAVVTIAVLDDKTDLSRIDDKTYR